MEWSTLILSLIITFTLLLQNCSAFKVVNSFYDTIHAGEVNYYSLESNSPIVIALYSVEGDADMYGSPTSKNPKPSSESFEYTSSTCGLDIMVLPMSSSMRKMSVGIYGHVRHENTSYHVCVIEPEEEDMMRYQVWESDPETNRDRLVIDIDPLVLANDPVLHDLLDSLYSNGQGIVRKQTGASDAIKTFFEWVVFVLLKILEIGVEILL